MLVTTSVALLKAVEQQLVEQLLTLPTAATARAALASNGVAVVVSDLAEGIRIANRLAP